jgi:hypothetical protein
MNSFFDKNDKFGGSEKRAITSPSLYYPNPCCYVTLPVDLKLPNFPKNSVVSFSIIDSLKTKNNDGIFIIDGTGQHSIPPPEFIMSASPPSVELRRGEQKSIRLQLNSTSYLETHVFLSASRLKDIIMNFDPDQIYVPPNGMATSVLQVKAQENTTEHLYKLPITSVISANIAFPQVNSSNKYTFDESQPTMAKNLHLLVTLLPPFSPEERLSNFYNAWLSPISGIWTFIAGAAAVIAPVIIKRRQKNKNDEENRDYYKEPI